MAKKSVNREVVTLVDFQREKRKESCPVCQLPDDVREQIRTASSKKIKRSMVIEWLREAVGVTLTDRELTAHANARHDDETA